MILGFKFSFSSDSAHAMRDFFLFCSLPIELFISISLLSAVRGDKPASCCSCVPCLAACGSNLIAVPCLHACYIRGETRARLNIAGSCCGDCMVSICCPCCSQIQVKMGWYVFQFICFNLFLQQTANTLVAAGEPARLFMHDVHHI